MDFDFDDFFESAVACWSEVGGIESGLVEGFFGGLPGLFCCLGSTDDEEDDVAAAAAVAPVSAAAARVGSTTLRGLPTGRWLGA